MRDVESMALQVADTVEIRSGAAPSVPGKLGKVVRVSKTGKRVMVDYGLACPIAFFKVSGTRYVANPGSGICGRLLNDYFSYSGPV